MKAGDLVRISWENVENEVAFSKVGLYIGPTPEDENTWLFTRSRFVIDGSVEDWVDEMCRYEVLVPGPAPVGAGGIGEASA